MFIDDTAPIAVVCASDNNYAMGLSVTIRSVLENLQGNRKINLFVIDGGIKNNNKKRILKSLSTLKCDIKFIKIPDVLLQKVIESHKPSRSGRSESKAKHVSIASFYRFLIPELVPNSLDRIIYLDCDLIVKGNLEEIWLTDLGDNYVLAVQDSWIPYVSSSTSFLNYKELGIPANTKYFNAGVLVINLNKWRADNITTKSIRYFMENFEYIGWYDQGVLNGLFAGQWGELDPRWNATTHIFGFQSWNQSPFTEEVYARIIHDPYIIHFVSEKKPWNSRHALCKEDFFQYVDMTDWAGWRLTFWKRIWLKFYSKFKALYLKLQSYA
ncbi:glycosyltransferase family 8 protein [Nostoc sp. FACHB-152]|uniref:glycosyltransferase family 8 protein n=1 Tax=unclassified Nostoc TaxID=2593658 RepID=UPI00168992C1|nr:MULTISPECIES: glycosyltransferase family 8 protein [unclassified Nostoc]MBD2445796.1 glycosyltransferase family 8 protein [Nostoc sp. FACHB-152]MBD2466910.1 glycosyltransferase family 8 protein [Nostoc sp. FACHB-145]